VKHYEERSGRTYQVVRGQTDDRYRRSTYKAYRCAAKEEKSGNGNGENEHLWRASLLPSLTKDYLPCRTNVLLTQSVVEILIDCISRVSVYRRQRNIWRERGGEGGNCSETSNMLGGIKRAHLWSRMGVASELLVQCCWTWTAPKNLSVR